MMLPMEKERKKNTQQKLILLWVSFTQILFQSIVSYRFIYYISLAVLFGDIKDRGFG